MIVLPTALVVAQWVVTVALGVLVIIAYRQLAFLLNSQRQVRELEGLPVGITIPSFDYATLGGVTRRFEARNLPWALLVADPLCITCEGALEAMEKTLDTKRHPEVRGLVLTSATTSAVESIPRFRDTHLEVGLVRPEVITDVLKVLATPYTYVIDGDGVVKSRGVAVDQKAMELLVSLSEDQTNETHVHQATA